jgi:hypothetical protein
MKLRVPVRAGDMLRRPNRPRGASKRPFPRVANAQVFKNPVKPVAAARLSAAASVCGKCLVFTIEAALDVFPPGCRCAHGGITAPGPAVPEAGQRQQRMGSMTNMKAIVASALMFISTATMANAAEKDADISTYSADYWLPYCKDYMDGKLDYLPNFCAGMIFGLGILLRQDPKSPLYCVDIPEGIKFEQAIRVVIRYIEEHPQDMHHPFKYLALVAIMDAWPCKEQ